MMDLIVCCQLFRYEKYVVQLSILRRTELPFMAADKIINRRIFYFLGAFAKFRKATISFFMSVHPLIRTEKNLASTGQIFVKFYVRVFFFKMSQENSSFIKIRPK
jgi:hypothetical protein